MSVTDQNSAAQGFDAGVMRRAMEMARETLDIETAAMQALQARLVTDDAVARAVALLLGCHGRVVVSGIGKSGHIGRKIAAT
ncbi:MAG TPA: KpsF/GutQ family sugar-phosphate isomerase, partial [Telluria sp.]|nr:KpsF/GutQ family sugar-phosphate isomerase [Telluria sp.]